ncbi:protein anon-73B1 [Diachasmimorpha longicaudata]|uniref:protein anon-73B1 n=1 Tax=Diachasmimorpha longicaudata TaxID=58733 RepID=UPI0030B8F46B
MENEHVKRLLLPDEETLLEQIVRYGLYVGAVFQVICILTVAIYHNWPGDGFSSLKDDGTSDVDCSENSPQVTPRKPHRSRRQEKKKRR